MYLVFFSYNFIKGNDPAFGRRIHNFYIIRIKIREAIQPMAE